LRRAQRRRREQRQAETARLLFDRTRRGIEATTPGRFRRAGIDRDDLMAATDNLEQGRYGKIGRAHEHDAQRHVTSPRAISVAEQQLTVYEISRPLHEGRQSSI